VVVADSRRAAGKLFIERVGFYDPKAPEAASRAFRDRPPDILAPARAHS